jgi:hypothetical protein
MLRSLLSALRLLFRLPVEAQAPTLASFSMRFFSSNRRAGAELPQSVLPEHDDPVRPG